MRQLDRRTFLKGLGAAGATVGVLGNGQAWSLNRLEPIHDTLKSEYPYRTWEDLYRNEWTWDKIGHAAHCINCMGNCAFDVYVKDGIVLREEQIAKYPSVNPRVPDANPRGCQKGAIHSTTMYEADRIRYPLKRAGERGEGKWQRISWDQATEEIADKIIDIFEKYGPGKLKTHQGSGNQSIVRNSGPNRFAALVGGIQLDGFTTVGDLITGAHLAYGHPLESFTSDAWFDADYILMSVFNPNATRIPDAHYIWEAQHNGCRIVSTAPDMNPSSIHADLWMPLKQGTDSFLAMSLTHVIIEENLYKPEFMKEQTDLPVLVRTDNQKLLRESDLEDGGSDEVFYHWDLTTNQEVKVKGSMGSEDKTLKLGDVDPALEGRFEVQGIEVTPVFEYVKKEAQNFSPEQTQQYTGLHPDMVRREARHMANADKAIVMVGFGLSNYSNGIYTAWSYALALALTGHGGKTGGLDTCWVVWNHPLWGELADFGGKKFPRYEPGGLGEFLRGNMMEGSRLHFDNAKLKERVGFDLDELEEMIQESIDEGWMPYYGEVKGMISVADNTFRRNKMSDRYREAHLEQASELYVNINVRMDSTAEWADYVLPAASHYEAWDLRTQGYHRFCNVFTRSVDPVGESKSDWDIMALLTKKIQERAIARGVSSYQDGDVTRDLHTVQALWTRMDSTTHHNLWGLCAGPDNTVYACGDAGTVLHYHGQRWHALPKVSDASVHSVWHDGVDSLYAAGSMGQIHRYDGSAWHLVHDLYLDVTILAMWGDSPNSIFAVGDEGLILHWDGSRWQRMISGTKSALYNVWGYDGDHVLAVGDFGLILRWNGESWAEFYAGTDNFVFDVWGDALDNIYIVGLSGTLSHFDGSRWNLTPARARDDIMAIDGGANAGPYAVGAQGTILSLESGRWKLEPTPVKAGLRAVQVCQNGDVIAAGNDGVILRRL